MPQFGPSYDLAARLKRIEDWVARQQANPLGQAFSATQSDGSIGMQIGQDAATGATAMIFRQGPATARDPNTDQHPTFLYVGELYAGGTLEDAGAIYSRPTGTESMVVGNRGAQILDPQGNQIFGSDEYGSSPSQVGLNTPFIGYGVPLVADASQWPHTTAASLSEVSLLAFPAQHSHIAWYGATYLASGAGQVQVTVNNGAAGATHTVGSGFTYLGPEVISLNAGSGWSFQQVLNFIGSAAVTSGAGPLYFGVFGVWGQGSGLT